MSTDNILLNPHALNSLKRAQLVALCKRNGLRASGKNTELIARLQEHGRSGAMASMFGDDQSSVASTAETEERDQSPGVAPRPSDPWSIIDEPAMAESFPTNKEFGGGAPSTKSSSVSSSIKLFASFLPGSHRSKASTAPSVVEPLHSDLPYIAPASHLPDDETGAGSDLELPAADAAADPNTSIDTIMREVTDLGASTVRLVNPTRNKERALSSSPPASPEYANPSPFKGKPFQNLPASASQLHLPLPLSPRPSSGVGFSKSMPPELVLGRSGSTASSFKPLYPTVTSSLRSMSTRTSDAFSIPGAFPEPPPRSYPGYAAASTNEKPPTVPTTMDPNFTFHVPLPKTSTAEQEAAREAVLEEMRKRMAEQDEGAGAEFSFDTADAGGSKKRPREDDEDEVTPKGSKPAKVTSKFDRMHQRQFDKMASIADHYSARRRSSGSKRLSANGAARLAATGHGRPRASTIGNRGGVRQHSNGTLRLAAQIATAPRASDERPGKRARISRPEDQTTPPPAPKPAATEPTTTLNSVVSPPKQVRIATIEAAVQPETIDATAKAMRKIEPTAAVADARTRRKSRSSAGRQSLARNAVLGGQAAPSASAKALAAEERQSGIPRPSIVVNKALLDSVPEQSGSSPVKANAAATPQRTGSRPLPNPVPNKFGFVGGVSTPRATAVAPTRSSVTPSGSLSPEKALTSPRFLLSPSSAVPKTTPGRPKKDPLEGFSFSSSPTKPSKNSGTDPVLNPLENVSTPDVTVNLDDLDKTITDATPLRHSSNTTSNVTLCRNTSIASSTMTTSTSASGSLRKRPHISRSKVIAKLDAKRAAGASDAPSTETTTTTPSNSLRGKTRSSVGVAQARKSPTKQAIPTRHSFATNATARTSAVPAPRGSGQGVGRKAVMDSWQHGVRKSEAAARRKLGQTSLGVGAS
ncbi:hypothetical protein DL93DRAFT_2157710 [Clavulina sp. PMI_390]|nr:hypothetical protein DL93DRAFT_2157710 [Clavulina sp. PMI_390]